MALMNKGQLGEARAFFTRAFERDPDYGAAYAMAAWTFMFEQRTSGMPLAADARAEALRLAHLAATVGTDDAFALARSGHVLTYLGHEYDRGMSMLERAVTLNPNLAAAWYSRGWVAMMCGETEQSIQSFDRMMRLSPLDQLMVLAWNGRSFALFSLGRYEDGRASAMKSIQFVKDAHTLSAFIVNAVRAGRSAEAREAAAQLLSLQPDFNATHAQEAFPVRSSDMRNRIIAALREAGLPG